MELRSPDGSANVHLLLAGVTVAARVGLTDPAMLDYANSRHVSGDASQMAELERLPTSCAEAARRLLAQRSAYEERGVFPAGLIDAWAQKLIGLGDETLREDIAEKRVRVEDLVKRYFHVG